MASSSETGHARNIAAFHKLISFVNGYGTAYNPSDPNLQLSELQRLYADAQAALIDLRIKKRVYDNKVNHRKVLFKDLRAFASRLISILKASKVSKELLADATGFTRKMRGGRAKSITPTINVDMTATMPARNSTSQQSYTQVTNHFSDLITLLNAEPNYRPNEPEAQIVNLQAKEQELMNINNEIDIFYVQLSNARSMRDNLLYKGAINLHNTAIEVKSYVRGAFGPKSTEYAKLKALSFSKVAK